MTVVAWKRMITRSTTLRLLPILAVALTAAVFHVISTMAVGLEAHPDSISHLTGAASFSEAGDLSGLGAARMPFLAILYGVFFKLFGFSAAWPLKVFLHLLGWTTVLLVYGTAWELSRKTWFALVCGLLAAVSPEFIYFCNVLLTEVPSGFLVMLTLYLLLRFIRTASRLALYGSMAAASSAVLVRSEYLPMLLLVAALSGAAILWNRETRQVLPCSTNAACGHVLLALALAGMPLVGWSFRNLSAYGTFRLTSYTGDVLYDGFVVAGNALGNPITDTDSPAVKELALANARERAQLKPRRKKLLAAVGHNTYLDGSYLQKFKGGTWPDTVSPVLMRAALDSMRSHPLATLRLVVEKVRTAAAATWSVGWIPHTSPLPDEPQVSFSRWHETTIEPYLKRPGLGDLLDLSYVPAPGLIRIQRKINALYWSHVQSRWYGVWRCLALAGIAVCLLGRPRLGYLAFSGISATVVLLPLVVGYPLGRYLVPGGFLMLVSMVALAVLGWGLLRRLLRALLRRLPVRPSPVSEALPFRRGQPNVSDETRAAWPAGGPRGE